MIMPWGLLGAMYQIISCVKAPSNTIVWKLITECGSDGSTKCRRARQLPTIGPCFEVEVSRYQRKCRLGGGKSFDCDVIPSETPSPLQTLSGVAIMLSKTTA
jgi:hypothetical protein